MAVTLLVAAPALGQGGLEVGADLAVREPPLRRLLRFRSMRLLRWVLPRRRSPRRLVKRSLLLLRPLGAAPLVVAPLVAVALLLPQLSLRVIFRPRVRSRL